MLTGRAPRKAGDADSPVPPVRELCPEVPSELDVPSAPDGGVARVDTPAAPAGGSTADVGTVKRPMKMELGFRGRYMFVPDSVMDIWYFNSDDPGANPYDRPKVRAYTVGVELILKPQPTNWILYVEYIGSNVQDVLLQTAAKAREIISAERAKKNETLCIKDVLECLDILGGAVSIVYPMGLPGHDPVRMELENREELQPASARDVIGEAEATLWFANKEMKREKRLEEYFGRNEKTKVVVRLSTSRLGQPAAESSLDEETRKRLMVENYRRMEELKRLEADEDHSYLNSDWADGGALKRKFQGLNNINFK